MAAASVLTLFACATLVSAATNVKAGRSYLGTIGHGGRTGLNTYVGSPIQLRVSADGKTATNIAAVYDTCRPVGFFGQRQVPFPGARIVNGAFKTAVQSNTKTSYATITIEGHFLSAGQVTGTITGATNISDKPGKPEPPCSATNPWSAKEKPSGFGVCRPVGLSDANADFIAEDHTSCKVAQKVIRKGYQGQGSFSSPSGWKCSHATIKTGPNVSGRGHQCKRKGERLQFAIV